MQALTDLLPADCLLGFLPEPEDGGDKLLRNVCELLLDYTRHILVLGRYRP
jgi:hypothetical protein